MSSLACTFVSLSDGLALKTRTITRLVRDEQINVMEFKKFKIAGHQSGEARARRVSIDSSILPCERPDKNWQPPRKVH